MNNIRVGKTFNGAECFECSHKTDCSGGKFLLRLNDRSKQQIAEQLLAPKARDISATTEEFDRAKASHEAAMNEGDKFLHAVVRSVVKLENLEFLDSVEQQDWCLSKAEDLETRTHIGILPSEEKDPDAIRSIKEDIVSFATEGLCSAITVNRIYEPALMSSTGS